MRAEGGACVVFRREIAQRPIESYRDEWMPPFCAAEHGLVAAVIGPAIPGPSSSTRCVLFAASAARSRSAATATSRSHPRTRRVWEVCSGARTCGEGSSDHLSGDAADAAQVVLLGGA